MQPWYQTHQFRCLEEAIVNFAGSVLVVSHDRWFLDRVATHILAFEGESQVRSRMLESHGGWSLTCFYSSSLQNLFATQVTWFEGGWADYEAYQRQKSGGQLTPNRVKFRKLATV